MRLVFAGTPAPAVPTLRALVDSPRHEVVAVVTRPPARAGRGRRTAESPVARLAAEAGLPVLAPARAGDPDFLARLAELEPDCCPVVAYGALLPPPALTVPRLGWVNLHFSLLPAWRGAAPVQHALLHGDDVTGASTFLIEAGLDTGPVFGVLTETVRPGDTAGDLLDRLAAGGAGLMLATMDGLADGSLVPVPQPGEGVSFAPKITVADAELDWTQPGRHVERLTRACWPAPGAWTTFRGERLKLGAVGVRAGHDLAPGELRVARDTVLAGTGSLDVALGTVQPPGKRPMPAADWARGARIEDGERLG
ncbi:methionyl-tRNA formyltransferase [Jatrophihabitans endophyticus]|uniref:Methionyl-tRNA formyltransferase n=1 Tax=Jatrophihabitans endophyticus TaxID=1206085 RepID=A0A1M5LT39_9ACTN|nr:methionyl-tRNA formyltransferase [Jatrophihabitans endophyticus]SHG68070.1 methionyl-tRNA formyltransferase [Jatrophihabitans endophyticus]